jgi:DNA invertase Pin-like site-specific DNA recombinase
MTETHPEKRLIDYARVSTYGQTLDSQLQQLRAAGCNSRNIYREKVTGARPDRRELNRMLGKLAPGDVVTVTRIDRLARSTFDRSTPLSASWTPRRSFGPWPSRGPIPASAPGA